QIAEWFGWAELFFCFAAVLVVSASALPLLPAHKVLGWFPVASSTSALQGGSKKTPPSLNSLVTVLAGVSPSAKRAEEASGRRARALFPEASRKQQALLGLPLGRATPTSAPSAVAAPTAHGVPKSQPASYVTGSAEEILAPGSPGPASTAPLHASPGPRHLAGEPKSSELSGLSDPVHAPALRIFITSGSTKQPAGTLPPPTTPVSTSGSPQWLAWPVGRPTSSPSAQGLSATEASNSRPGPSPPPTLAPGTPEKAVSSASHGSLSSFTSISNTSAATKPHLPGAAVWSRLDTAAAALTVGSRSPGSGLASRLGPGPRGPSVLPVPSTAPSSWSSSPSLPLSSPAPALLPLSTSLSPVLAPVSAFTTRARISPDTPVSARPPMATGLLFKVSSVPAALPPLVDTEAALQWTVQPGPVTAGPAPWATLSLRGAPGLPSSCASVPEDAASPKSSSSPHPGQAVSLQDSGFSSPGRSRVTRSVTFRITSEDFSAALGNPASPAYQLLSKNIRHQLQSIYHEAFSSFEGVSVLLLRPGTVAVNASLVFGGQAPGPSARDVLWTLYRKVKAAGQMLGNLSLDGSRSNLSDLALETITIQFTAMRPFQPLLLLPGSAPFVLLEEKILRQVTPVASGFFPVHPQQGPLLLFSNVDQWVGVYIEYKFQAPISTHLQGLANHLAQNIMDPAVQKSSITANGEKAELVLYEVWLQIVDQPFNKAWKDKTSPKFWNLQGNLTRWLTAVLRPLQNFGQVVVKFQPNTLTAWVGATFFRAAPVQALVQDCVLQALPALQEAEGLLLEVINPDLGQCPSPCFPPSLSRGWGQVAPFWGTSLFPALSICLPPPGAPSAAAPSTETKFQKSPSPPALPPASHSQGLNPEK
uniref:SEA domain-containing protein n=1 Tax=Sus scrofa TaxID=9823 RepID=A0A8D1TI54_PIG